MCAMEIDLGHSAWQAPVLVQLPKPSSSILATIALARRAPSTRPCGSLASDDTRAATDLISSVYNNVSQLFVEKLYAADVLGFFNQRSEEHTSDSSHKVQSRMPSSA